MEDVIEAFLRAGVASTKTWRVYNIGGPEALTITQIADVITRVAHTPPAVRLPFPCTVRSIDIGSYVSDCRRARCGLQWEPLTPLEAGVRKTIEYYNVCASEYLAGVEPRARLPK